MGLFEFDFLSLFSLTNLFAILIGSFIGILIGALPGLGPMIGMVLVLPFTYSMPPLAAILLLLSLYQAAEYGGSISSITMGIPGTPAAAATLLDGNTLAKKSSPGKALAYSLTSSTIGGLFGGIVLLLLSIPLGKLALQFFSTEYFLIGLLGLLAVGGISSKNKMRSMISVVLGLLAGTVGIDMFTGHLRFTFGQVELMDGISIVALAIGVFAITEIFNMISQDLNKKQKVNAEGLKTSLTLKEFKRVSKPTFVGSGIGSIIGIMPGLGAGVASWFAYSAAKKVSKKPETFGKGNPEGIAGPESANNAAVGGALVPLLTLGIPGSATMAIVIGAFIIQGITPGPRLFETESTLVYGILYGFLLTTVAMYLLGRLVTPMFARVLTVPSHILIPLILILSIVGVYATNSQHFDLWLALGFGIIFYVLRKLEFSLPAFILAFVLSPIIEENLRRALIVSDGSYLVFFTRPYSIVIICLIIVLTFFMFRRKGKSGDVQA